MDASSVVFSPPSLWHLNAVSGVHPNGDDCRCPSPGSTISAVRLPKTQGNYADINLKTGKATAGRCVIKISGFASAIGARRSPATIAPTC
jgi:hypothetical protein